METLANKYRPKTFDDVCEQDTIKVILENQLNTGTIKSAYLFCGSAGTGKTTCARIFAQEINEHQGYPIEIDGASNNGVDNVREIIKQAQTKSISSKYKIFIIDECHSISSTGWQAFLKLIEEPPLNTIFIFCTTDPQKIPRTILSRVQRYDFKRISQKGVISRLKHILESEYRNATEWSWDNDAIEYIARLADGGMRDAITMLDKCLSFNDDLTVRNVIDALNASDYNTMFELTEDLYYGDARAMLYKVEKLHSDGVDLKNFCKQYQDFILDVLKYQFSDKLEYTKIPTCYKENVENLNKFGIDWYLEVLDNLNKLNNDIKWDNTPKYQIEAQFTLMFRRYSYDRSE